MFKFEKLEVWQRSIEFADLIYELTRSFPAEERFGLTSQLRRSAVSISSNIAEGSSRSSDADLRRFLEIAYGSLLESVAEFEVARRQKFVSHELFQNAYGLAEELAKMLSGFRRSLR